MQPITDLLSAVQTQYDAIASERDIAIKAAQVVLAVGAPSKYKLVDKITPEHLEAPISYLRVGEFKIRTGADQVVHEITGKGGIKFVFEKIRHVRNDWGLVSTASMKISVPDRNLYLEILVAESPSITHYMYKNTEKHICRRDNGMWYKIEGNAWGAEIDHSRDLPLNEYYDIIYNTYSQSAGRPTHIVNKDDENIITFGRDRKFIIRIGDQRLEWDKTNIMKLI